jgi:hypothetical protein
MISRYERKERKCDTVCDPGIQKSPLRKIHNIEAKTNSSHASATPSASMSNTRPEMVNDCGTFVHCGARVEVHC